MPSEPSSATSCTQLLLKSLPGEDERDKAAVYMDGLATDAERVGWSRQ